MRAAAAACRSAAGGLSRWSLRPVVLGVGESAQQQQRRKAPARRSPRKRRTRGRAEIKREQQPGAARVGGGRRLGAQRRRHVELQRHRDRHLRRHRQQPAAERRVRLLRRHHRGGRRARPAGRAAQEQRRRPLAQHRRRPPSTTCRATTPSPRRARSTRSPPRSSARCTASACSTCKFTPAVGQTHAASTEDLKEYREAIIRLKHKDGLYVDRPVRRRLHRQQPVPRQHRAAGQRHGRAVRHAVYLFREEKLLSHYTVRLTLEREGLERHLHAFAFGLPTLYGFVTVMIAVGAGLLASTVFRTRARTRIGGGNFNPRSGTASPRGKALPGPASTRQCRRCRTAARRPRRAR